MGSRLSAIAYRKDIVGQLMYYVCPGIWKCFTCNRRNVDGYRLIIYYEPHKTIYEANYLFKTQYPCLHDKYLSNIDLETMRPEISTLVCNICKWRWFKIQ